MDPNTNSISLLIPPGFFNVPYKGTEFPGVAKGLVRGANCQHFCYEILSHFGFEMAPFRSSELWSDREYTEVVAEMRPLDLILFNKADKAFGAHVGILVGSDQILHLSKKVGYPVIWPLKRFTEFPEYSVLVGIKRPTKYRGPSILGEV